MDIRKPTWFGLFAVLAGLARLPAAPAETGAVVFVSRPELSYVEYKITDAELGREIATLTPDSYTKVSVPAARKLKIWLRIRIPFSGGMGGNAWMTMTVGPDLAGKVFVLRRTRELYVKPEAVEEPASDLSALTYWPDLTGPLTLGSEPDAYNRTFRLLDERQPWDEISASAAPLTADRRRSLYDRFQLDGALAWGNLFPGLGWGSFQQGDWPVGTAVFVGEGVSGAAVLVSGGLLLLETLALAGGGIDTKDPRVTNIAKTLVISAAAWVVIRSAAVWRSLSYTGEFNGRLASSLDVTP